MRNTHKYMVFDQLDAKVLQAFATKKACKAWLLEGLFGTEGAERDHYVYMLEQLAAGKKILCYWETN